MTQVNIIITVMFILLTYFSACLFYWFFNRPIFFVSRLQFFLLLFPFNLLMVSFALKQHVKLVLSVFTFFYNLLANAIFRKGFSTTSNTKILFNMFYLFMEFCIFYLGILPTCNLFMDGLRI